MDPDFELLGRLLDQDPTLLTRFDNDIFSIPGNDTILHEAVRGSSLEVVRYLVERGADVNAHSDICAGDTPLDVAIKRRDPEFIGYLLEQGANPNVWSWMWITATERAIEKLDRTEYTSDTQAEAFRDVIRAAKRFPPPSYPDGTVPSFWPPQRGRKRPERVEPRDA